MTHILAGADIQSFSHPSLSYTLKGIARQKKHVPKQAFPITVEMLKKFKDRLDLRSREGSTTWALFLLAFLLMARKSNLVPDSEDTFDPKKQLTRNDITFNDRALLVNIKWSKTLQFGKREHVVPLLAQENSELCPVRAYKNMICLNPGHSSEPAFTLLSKRGRKIPVTYKIYQEKIKKLTSEIGENPACYSSHSFRRGGASFASQVGIERELIMLLGDWRSSAVDNYIYFTMDQKIQAANSIGQAMSDYN